MITNNPVFKDLVRLESNYGISIFDLVKKYTVTNEAIKKELEDVALAGGGVIPEHEINKHGLTPRHVQITFDGKYRVALVPQGD